MLDWNNIDTVLLDMDGTLLDLEFDNYFWQEHVPQAYAAKHGISTKESTDQISPLFDIGRGTLDWYCVDAWSERLGLDIPALKQELGDRIQLRPFALEFLQQLHSSHRRVLLVTNAHRKTLEIKMGRVDISQWFDALVVSHELNSPKEQRSFWEKLQRLHPFDRERTLLIDDTEAVLDSAQAYGIKHLLTLVQPDSQQQKRLNTRFPGIHHFDEIMPDCLSQ